MAKLGMMDRVYGAVAAVAIVLALWFLLRGGSADGAVGNAARLVIEQPAGGAEVAQPVTLVFTAGAGLDPNGTDSTGTRHVHAELGSAMLMPGPGDIVPLGGGRYRWTLARRPAGEAVLRLYWSDAQHRAIAGAPADSVRLRLR